MGIQAGKAYHVAFAQQTEKCVEERIGEREITMDSRVVVPNV
jgi:hypothetical protein